MMRTIALVTGRLEQGKSTLAYHRAREINPGKGLFIWDPRGQFHIGTRIFSLDDAQEKAKAQPVALVWQPVDVENEFEEFARTVESFKEPVVLIDEASFLQKPQWIHPDLDRLVLTAIIPDRARETAGGRGDQRQVADTMVTEWERFKADWEPSPPAPSSQP